RDSALFFHCSMSANISSWFLCIAFYAKLNTLCWLGNTLNTEGIQNFPGDNARPEFEKVFR
ncbi:hypothetical protein, partial [Marinoscillum furvescens]|uniref:hypothetical protein n=1 Tax=Marinoscillum furvescens TaxID=1026 RepID=UPI001C87BEB9